MKKSKTPRNGSLPKERGRKKPDPSHEAGPTVVGIGASAGGLGALKTFFDHVPADSGLAYVVVVHLSPEHKSHLADLLQPHVKMPVEQVTETVPLEPDHVYVIPPNANLNTIDTHLRLSDLEERRRERAPIDHFFRTLATTHDGHAIGVVLTGTGSDGTLGIKDIKAHGGFVLVQDPNEAEYDGMPQSAIATGLADFVLPVAKIPETILRFERTRPRVAVPAHSEKVTEDEARVLQRIFTQLHARTHRDFSRYKPSTILRRIGRRMQLAYLEDLQAYLEKLRQDPEEVYALADDLLITVTHFFRDPEVFEKLEKEVIPGLFDGRTSDDPIRIWSVGCATGEEAYSLAMLLVEEAARRDARTPVQIFASDLHEKSLTKAREGFYPGDIATDVSAERLHRFFHEENAGYRIQKEIRELVVFAPHNLLSDPPFSRLDLVTSRNLLIYLQREVQADVIDLFHYALRPEGWLLLGSAETIEAPELFRTEDKKLRFYRKRNVPAPEPRLPVFPLTRPIPPLGPHSGRSASPEPISHGIVLQRMMERHGPPCLLIGGDSRVAQIAGNAGRYLVHPSGDPTHNAFKLVREELRVELRTSVQAARETGMPVDSNPVPVRLNGAPHPVVLHVRPGAGPEEEGFVLVLFEELEPRKSADEPTASTAGADADKSARQLEDEIRMSRQRLQAIIEEYETSQEEMKASNEEMQSVNEELRSTMEELETSKEELQSINEELQTVNQENRHKVEELAQLSGDLQNLLAATDIATLFLDRDLRILRFTPKVSELFNVKATDRGRPISDLTHRLGYNQLKSDAKAVLDRLAPIEREVRDDEGRCYLTRVLPYRSLEDHIEGVVITFVDITRRQQAEQKLRESEESYRMLVNNAREYAILMVDLDGRITSWNVGAERIFGYQEKEMVGRPFWDLFTEEARAAGIPQAEIEGARRSGIATNEGWRVRKDGSRLWASGTLEALISPDGSLRCFAKVLRDNTERREAEESLRRLAESLEAQVEQRTRQVRDLSVRLTMAEHRERDRIARILHDDLQQLLYSIKMQLMFIREALDRTGQEDLISRTAGTEELLGQGIQIAQRLAVDLSPQVLDKEGLREMVRWLGDHMKEQHGLKIVLKAENSVPAPKALRVLLFQAVRELLFNVIKHSGVKQATVDLRQGEGEYLIRVMDKGKGFEANGQSNGFGMSSIRHRLALMGGRMEIDSRPGKGSTITIALPAAAEDALTS